MRLVLFDIDGTILKVDRTLSHRIATEAINSVLGRSGSFEVPDSYRLHGRTDKMIFLDLCEFLGEDRTEVEPLIPDFEDRLTHGWHTHLNEKTVKLLPGIESLLETLDDDEKVELGLLTGNILKGARAKLNPHNLNKFFRFGAFGSDAHDRNALPPIALKRANQLNDYQYSFDHVVIIGDSHRDIECAHAWGIRAIAVATGGLSTEELQKHNPEMLVPNLEGTESLLNFIHD